MNAENLVETKTSQEIVASFATVDHVKMSMPQFLQAQSHARHCPHESGIHHDAFFQVHDEFAVAPVDHLAGKLLEVAAVEEAALALNLHPNGIAVYSDLYRRLHCVRKYKIAFPGVNPAAPARSFPQVGPVFGDDPAILDQQTAP